MRSLLFSGRLPGALLLAASGGFLGGCDDAPTSAPTSPKWSESKPAYFSYAYVDYCLPCSILPDTVFVTAAADSVLSAFKIRQGDTLWITAGYQAYSLDTLLARATAPASYYSVTGLTLDSTYGFPASLSLSWSVMVHSYTRTYSVNDFHPGSQPSRNLAEETDLKWAARPAHFAYTIWRDCYCQTNGSYRVVATRDSVQSARFLSWEGDSVSVTQRLQDFSIDTLRALLREAVKTEADGVSVTYDPTLGFPKYLFIDYRLETTDEVRESRITDFQSLP